MEHRHIHSTGTYTLPEIDNVIDRGSWEDWLAMREVADVDRIRQICLHKLRMALVLDDPFVPWQRYAIWWFLLKPHV